MNKQNKIYLAVSISVGALAVYVFIDEGFTKSLLISLCFTAFFGSGYIVGRHLSNKPDEM